MEISFRVDRKITLFWRKTISAFILPSNQLHSSHSLKASHTHSSQTHSKLSCDRAPQSKTRQTMSLHRPSSSPTTHTPPIHPQWVSFTVWTKNFRQPHHFSPIHPLFQSNPPSILVRSTPYFTPIHPPFQFDPPFSPIHPLIRPPF